MADTRIVGNGVDRATEAQDLAPTRRKRPPAARRTRSKFLADAARALDRNAADDVLADK